MSVTIKNPHEIEKIRESCRLLAIVHDEIGKMIEPGVSTWELDREAVIRVYGDDIAAPSGR